MAMQKSITFCIAMLIYERILVGLRFPVQWEPRINFSSSAFPLIIRVFQLECWIIGTWRYSATFLTYYGFFSHWTLVTTKLVRMLTS